MSDKKNTTINVTSHNQSGGITAGTVNIGRQKFVLADEHIHRILGKVSRDKPVILRTVGGERAQELGNVVHAKLTNAGLDVYIS